MSISKEDLAEIAGLCGSEEPAKVARGYNRAIACMGREPQARRLAAAAYDRGRALDGRRQKFGTASISCDGKIQLWPCEPRTTDSERAKWGLPSLAKLVDRASEESAVGKSPLRRLARARRRALSSEHRTNADFAAAGLAALEDLVDTSSIIGVYWPLPDEADPRPLARALRDHCGARLALPVTLEGEGEMEFRIWSEDSDLVDAGYGTLGPAEESAQGSSVNKAAATKDGSSENVVDPSRDVAGGASGRCEPTIVLVPLVAFDADGRRLGQGKGYYDRSLHGDVLAVGVAFACQELSAVPTEAHDRYLDAAVTENGFRWFAEGPSPAGARSR